MLKGHTTIQILINNLKGKHLKRFQRVKTFHVGLINKIMMVKIKT